MCIRVATSYIHVQHCLQTSNSTWVSHGIVPLYMYMCILTDHPVGTSRSVPPSIPFHCTMGRKGRSGNACIPTVHPIPSQCTVGRKGRTGNIPTCTTPHACIPTVHPIPMYRGKEGTEWEHPNLHHSPCLYPTVHPIPMYRGKEGTDWEHPNLYCSPCLYSHRPSHPNVPWEGRDGVGTSQPVPLPMPVFPPSSPSQCTVGRKGRTGNIPTCTTPHACIPTVHPIPMYRGKEGTDWEHPNLYHSPYIICAFTSFIDMIHTYYRYIYIHVHVYASRMYMYCIASPSCTCFFSNERSYGL